MNKTLLPVPGDLICPAQDILNFDELDTAISKVVEGSDDALQKRASVVSLLAGAKTEAAAQIAAAFSAKPRESRPTTGAYAWMTDAVVALAFDAAQKISGHQSVSDNVAVVAVGGYGRAEMAPHSDVDLLFLTEQSPSKAVTDTVQELLYILWDLKLKVGHATRSIRECLTLGREDFTIRTTLVEQRLVAGNPTVFENLGKRLQKDLFQGTAADFIEAKLTERSERHTRQGGQRYMVEPNVKEGKGGLRDLQSLFWIAKYVNGVSDAADLVPLGVFSVEEFEKFVAAEDFLWAVRCHLHLLARRAMDQLNFDLQVEVAERMGYHDTAGRRAVEVFMQDYFRHATQVGELTRIFLTAMEAAHVKQFPSLTRWFQRPPAVRSGFEVRQNRLDVPDEDAFLSDKLNFLKLFEEGLRTGLLIHPDAMRLVSSNLDRIDDELRKDPKAVQIFLDLLLKHGNPERALRRMNELGVLGAFIPEFEPIVAMMQFNMYHSYTVDEHTIQTISHLAKIEREELVEELPVASGILKEGVNRKILYVALLLHDIGKGRPEDHSILGAQITRKVAPRLGLNKQEAETAEWLVRYHLLMSDMAQKRDIADPRTVRDFAKAVGSVKRLDLLTVLTVCDISGVGPDTWNNWKAVLIRALYRQTRRALEDGWEANSRQNRGIEAKKKLRETLPGWSETDMRRETNRHYPPYWQGLHVTAHARFAGMLRDLDDDEIRIDVQPDDDRDATSALFAMADHPGIFSRITGALALAGANVVDARTFTSKDGYVTAAFWIQDQDEAPYSPERLPSLERMINRILAGEVIAGEAMEAKDKLKKRERPFKVQTHITFDNDGSDIYTIIEVDTRDRRGLLYDLTRTMAHSNIGISSAVIATYGEQVVDTFYVKDTFGLKIHSKSKQEALEKKLRDAIMRGTERALS